MSAALKRVRPTGHKEQDEVASPSDPAAVGHRFESDRNHGMTALMRAVCDGSDEEVRKLLDQGAQVNESRQDGFTPLSLAAFFGRTELVKLLLERGADFRSTTRCGTSAEMWATAKGFQEIGELLNATRAEKLKDGAWLKVVRHEADDSSTTLNTQVPNLPEVIDPEPVAPPAFHPAQVFWTRVTSSGKHLTALLVAVMIALGLVIFSIYQIGRALKNQEAQTVEGSSPVSDPATHQPVSGFEQSEKPTAGSDVPSTSFEHSQEIRPPVASVEPDPETDPSQDRSAKASPKTTKTFTVSEAAAAGSNLRIDVPASRTTRLSRSSHLASEESIIPATSPNQKSESDPEAKPAPMTIEAKGNPARLQSVEEGPRDSSRSAPLGITPAKSKSKVIQWP